MNYTEQIYNNKRKRGVALVSVLLLCTAIIAMLGVLTFNFRSKKATQTFHYETTKALLAANSAIQLASYKFRALPSEYYKIVEMERKKLRNESAPNLEKFKQFWIHDFSSDSEIGKKILKEINSFCEGDNPPNPAPISFGIDSFDVVSSEDNYSQDYVRIKAWGKCGSMRKDIEEILEITTAHEIK